MKKFLSPVVVILILVFTGCKMWPASVGLYNKSAKSIEVELYVNNAAGAAEVFPLVISKFDEEYMNSGSRNVSPLKLDTVDHNIIARYSLGAGECLNIGKYWDDQYQGYLYYQSSKGASKTDQADKIERIIIRHPQTTISGSPEHLDGLVKPLNFKKKIWGIVIK